MTTFRHRALPMRVRFGPGSLAELPDELDELGLRRALVLSTPGHRGLAERVAGLLGDRAVGVHAGAVMHVPVEVADAAVVAAREAGADGLVAVGGGSTIGLGKAVALRDGLPVVAVPTTYAGSEMTPVWGLTESGAKRTGRDEAVLPRGVVYDPELTITMPVELSVVSGVNALAHAAEALYAPDGSPVIALTAEESVRALTSGLAAVAADPSDVDGRATALYGAWLAGACLGVTTMGLHHKLCHTLGGMLNLPHAPTHTVVLPHVLAFNASHAPDAMRVLARAMSSPVGPARPGVAPLDGPARPDDPDPAGGPARSADPARSVRDLAARLGAPTSLRELGADRDALPGVAVAAASSPYGNPRPASEQEIAALLDRAWAGADPVPAR